ncbi:MULTISPECIES: SPOR domain-containing protein [unclassified Halomonas]|uniref:SPOR domain-containing protein n=1 Tax=unclassified Halomonas TaxID=2609666 RepID=UPI002076946A|nr:MULTISPECIES: SPOR domain-containing protein [unclassified Halomonas]
MKYGKAERISGIVILLALLAIFVPWLMGDPAPREERPQPTFVIEQPESVARRDVPEPQAPASVEALANGESAQGAGGQEGVDAVPAEPRAPLTDRVAAAQSGSNASEAPREAPGQADPIAEIVAANTATSNTSSSANQTSSAPTTAAQGEWAVQVGSFGDISNAERLSEQLSNQGFSAFRRARDNNLTSVYVGPYATSEEGESAMTLIKQRANVQGLLVRVRD